MLSMDEESVFLDFAAEEKNIICTRSQTPCTKADKARAWDSITLKLSDKLGRTFTSNKVQRRWQNILQRMKGHFGRRLAELCGITGTPDVNTIPPERVARDLPLNDRRVLQIVGIDSLKAFYYVNSIPQAPSLTAGYNLENSSASLYSRLSNTTVNTPQQPPIYEVKHEDELVTYNNFLHQPTNGSVNMSDPSYRFADTDSNNITSEDLTPMSINREGATAATSSHSVESFHVTDVVTDVEAHLVNNNHCEATNNFATKEWYKKERRRLKINKMQIEVEKMQFEKELLALQVQKMHQDLYVSSESTAKKRRLSNNSHTDISSFAN